MTLFELAGKITLDSSEYESGMKGALGTADKFAKRLDGGIGKLMKIGMTAGGAAVAAVTAFGKAAVKTGMQFDTAMSQVAATMGVTTDQIGELRDFAQEMGAKTAFSATQAAEALNYMALAGYDADTSMKMLPNVLNLAAAGAMDLGRASDMLTDSQSALGLTIEETNTLVDQMAKTASKSNTSVSQLGDAILTVGGTARNLRGGTTELATALGILADNGVKGAEGGTALRNILLSLSAPTDVAAKKMQELGVSVFDAEGNMRGLNDIFEDLDDSLGALTQEQRMEALATIFNNRDLKSATALMSNYGARWDELTGYIEDAAGAAKQMADTQLDNLNGDITLMKSALEGVKIEFSDGINPALRDATQRMTALLSKNTTQKFFREFGEAVGDVATSMTKWTSNALPRLIKEFENGAPRIKAFGAAFAGLALAVKATVNPVGSLLTAVGLLSGGMALAALGADDMGKKFSKLTDTEYDQIDAVQSAGEAYEETKSARDKNMAAISAETERTQELWNELQGLVGANGEVAESDRARADFLSKELNKQLGTELDLNNGIIESYHEQAAAIDNLIKKRQAERMLAAGEDTYNNAKQNLDDVRSTIFTQQQDVNDLKRQMYDLQSQAADIESIAYSDRTAEQGAELATINQNIKDLAPVLAERNEALQESLAYEKQYIQDIQSYSDAETAFLEGNYEAATEIFERDTINRAKHLADNKVLNEQELKDLKRNADIAKATAERYAEELAKGTEGYTEEGAASLQAASDEWQSILAEAASAAAAAGDEFAQAFAAGILSGLGAISGAAAAASAAAAGGLVVPGGRIGFSSAVGREYVPYDDFPATLHRGEMVLTREEAKDYRDGDRRRVVNENSFNFYGVSQSDMDMIADYLDRKFGM